MNAQRFARRWQYLPEFALAQTPRYTSYPPANRFEPIDQSSVRQAIEALPHGARLSLYLHIPYCRKLCWYCGCHTSVPTESDPLGPYVDSLIREIALIGSLAPKGAVVSHVHLGGGSPDILSPAQVGRLFAVLRASFQLAPGAEIAAEFDPRGLTPQTIAAFALAGLTRASLGVQTLDPAVQARINRIQTREEIETAIRLLRSAGVRAFNMDLMYGLPGQTRQHVIEAASFAARNDANRIAVFGYAHVPWMKKHQKALESAAMAEGEERFRQAEAAAETLETAGYVAIGFDHYAAPGDSLAFADRRGTLRRNFQGYTDDNADALIGFGASAISSLPTLIYQNATDSLAYRGLLDEGLLPAVRGRNVSSEDRRIGRVIEDLLCRFETDVPGDLLMKAAPRLTQVIGNGLATRTGTHLTVTAKGRPYVRNIASCFDPDLQPAQARHSVSV